MTFLKRNLLSMLTLAAMVVTSVVLFGELPQRIPSNFNLDGSARSTQPKELAIILLPLAYLALIVVINILIKLSPGKFSMPNSKRAMDIVLFGVGLMICFIHYAMLANNGNFNVFELYFSYGLALFLVVVGNVFGKTERNFFIGIRLPWTIASPANWKATHRFAGRLMVVSGVVLLLSNSLFPNIFITVALATITAILPVVYSIQYFMRYEPKKSEKND